MNLRKAAYFDDQVEAPWAALDYGAAEADKIQRLLCSGAIAPGQWILEPGCGTGRLTAILATAVGDTGSVVALDISARMVQASRERLAGRTNIQILHAALEDFRGAARRFDRIVCHQVFPHFDDPAVAVRRMADLLAPSGLVVVAHFINVGEVNDRHRKAGTAVARDRLPGPAKMRRLFAATGLVVDMLTDDALGYFLRAVPRDGTANGR
jgi:demethylmenaquinone methyltransferase/2-methoxy-6-polyprenyl-1,4-benzoquinol methylase